MSEHYTVLARRYRPQTFDDVVGQQHVGTALRNAIASDRIAHAYLFTGARGVGKTSTARIFAKALNCPNVEDGRPCNACEVCEAIGAGSDVDVLEIDGASNRGIDDIRQLRANVGIRPMRSPRKVYIVDEVHMLTKEAFNALLKTLEEPPPNVNFVFCTTEPQKVPDTILSRCQRFDFGTIETDKITDRLTEIAKAEGTEVDAEAVAMVARRAGGSMRDSQSLFDQLLAFGGETITADDVHRLFGTAPDERIIAMIEAILTGDRAAALGMLDAALGDGVRLESLADQLVAVVRDLMVLAGGAGEADLMGVGEPHRATLQDQANRWGLRTATAALQILADSKLKMSRTVHARPLVELAIVRLTLLGDLDQIAELVARMRQGGGSLPAAASDGKKKVGPSAVAAEPTPEPHDAAASDDPADRAASMKRMLAQQQQRRGETQPPQPSPRDDSGGPQPLSDEAAGELLRSVMDRLPKAIAKSIAKPQSVSCEGENGVRIELRGDNAFHRRQFAKAESVEPISRELTAAAGRPIAVRITFDQSQPRAAAPRPQRAEPSRRDNAAVENDSFVRQVLEAFGGGQIVQVTAESGLDAASYDGASPYDDPELESDLADDDDL